MDPNAALLQLQQELATLQNRFEGLTVQDLPQLQAAVQALAAPPAPAALAAAAAPAVAPVPAAVPVLKPARPDTFSSVRASGRPEAWLFVVDTYLEAAEITDPHTIRLVATLLRGPAALWWQSHVRSVRDAGAAPINTWALFQAAFTEQFAPVSNVRQARDRLRNLV